MTIWTRITSKTDAYVSWSWYLTSTTVWTWIICASTYNCKISDLNYINISHTLIIHICKKERSLFIFIQLCSKSVKLFIFWFWMIMNCEEWKWTIERSLFAYVAYFCIFAYGQRSTWELKNICFRFWNPNHFFLSSFVWFFKNKDFIILSIHVWQFDPVYWGLHKQTYPPLLKVWQVPPFKHWLLLQAEAIWQFDPLKPSLII